MILAEKKSDHVPLNIIWIQQNLSVDSWHVKTCCGFLSISLYLPALAQFCENFVPLDGSINIQ